MSSDDALTREFFAGVAQTFTAHNIRLDDGSETLPGRPLTSESESCTRALEAMKATFRSWHAEPPTVADLGCLEGGHSVAFARAGYDVTGYEARTENIACCRYVADRVTTRGPLRFEQADVRSVITVAAVVQQEWDAVYCGGLLYHMEYPASFLDDVGRATRKLLIIDTHFSVSSDSEHEGYRGHWHHELNRHRWSAWNNTRSFWLTEEDLVKAIRAAGFSSVEKVTGTGEDRGIYVARKDRR